MANYDCEDRWFIDPAFEKVGKRYASSYYYSIFRLVGFNQEATELNFIIKAILYWGKILAFGTFRIFEYITFR